MNKNRDEVEVFIHDNHCEPEVNNCFLYQLLLFHFLIKSFILINKFAFIK
jgi:hypothetical protein